MIDLFIILLFFLSSSLYGFILLRKYHRNKIISSAEFVVFGLAIGICVSSLLIYGLSHLISLRASSVFILSISLSILLYQIYHFKNKFVFSKNYSLLLFNFFWLITFSLIIYATHLKPSGEYLNTSPSTFGDFPFHLGLINNFAFGDNFPAVNPIAPFTNLSYHFIADFISAISISMGASLRGSLIYPSIILGMLTVNSMYLLVLRIFSKKTIAFISVYLFMFNGGFGFIKPFLDKLSFNSFFNGTIRFAHITELGIEYPNILVEILMAERALFVGIPLWITSIFIFYLWYLKEEKKSLIIFAVIIGLLPYANIYAFLVNIFFIFFIFIYKYLIAKKRLNIFEWLRFSLIILIIAFPIFYNMFLQITGGQSFLRISLFEWPPMGKNIEKYFFWINNFGLVPITFFCSSILFYSKNKKSFNFLIILSSIILIAHVIIFQPYAWDNNRFILYPYFGLCVISAYLFHKLLFNNNYSVKIFGLFIFMVSIASGILVTINDPQMSFPLFNKEDLNVAKKIRETTDSSGIFLTARNHNNIISSLVGRKVILGFGGYLWTHGISNTEQIERDMSKIYAGSDESFSLLNKHHIRYIFIGGWEKNEYKDIDMEAFKSKYKIIFENKDYLVLDTF